MRCRWALRDGPICAACERLSPDAAQNLWSLARTRKLFFEVFRFFDPGRLYAGNHGAELFSPQQDHTDLVGRVAASGDRCSLDAAKTSVHFVMVRMSSDPGPAPAPCSAAAHKRVAGRRCIPRIPRHMIPHGPKYVERVRRLVSAHRLPIRGPAVAPQRNRLPCLTPCGFVL